MGKKILSKYQRQSKVEDGDDFQGFALNSNNINRKRQSQEEGLVWRENEFRFSLGLI